MKTGLVLEGGGVRGIYTAGVLDVFMEHGLTFDGLIGVSAGAIHGCSYLSGQKGRSIRYYKKYSSDPRFMSIQSWLTTGDVVGAEFCYHELPDKLDPFDHDAFQANPVPFWAVCSNIETGRPEYIRLTDMRSQIEYLRASASLPYFSRIVELDGKKYLDGGCTDSIPIKAAQELGFERNVAVLTQPGDYRKKPELALLAKIVYRKYPAFSQALLARHQVYNQTAKTIESLEREGHVFVIRPEAKLNIGRMETNGDKIQQVYDQGRSDGEKRLEALKNWLNG